MDQAISGVSPASVALKGPWRDSPGQSDEGGAFGAPPWVSEK